MRSSPTLGLLLLVALLAAPAGTARSLSVTLGWEGAPPLAEPLAPRGRLSLHDLRVDDDAFDLGLGWVDGTASVALGWRRTLAAGPLGTLVLDGRLGFDGGGLAGAAGVRGTAGPVALRLELEAGTRPPGSFVVLQRAPSTAPPTPDGRQLGDSAGGGLRVTALAGATWRIDRRWTVEFAPRVHAAADGWAWAASAYLRRAAPLPDVDLSARLELASGAAARHAAIGVTLHHVPRRAPESRLTAWYGGGPHGTGPGVEFALTAREGATQLVLAGGHGPPWADRARSYAAVALRHPWAEGTAHLGWRWVAGGSGVWEIGWTRPLAP